MSATPKNRKKVSYTDTQVDKLIEHNTWMQNELKKIRLPKEMTPEEYNDVVKYLRSIKERFEKAEPAPQYIPESKTQDDASDSHI